MGTRLVRDGGWRSSAGLLVLLPVVLPGSCWAQSAGDGGPLAISSTPASPTILVGQPLFMEVVLRNQSKESQRLRDLPKGYGFSKLGWRLQVAESDAPFRDVELRLIRHSKLPLQGGISPVELPPGTAVSDCLTIWFAAHGDIPGERSLVFRSQGRFRYRLVSSINLADQSQKVTAEGRVKVTGRKRGFSEMVAGLRGIMRDDSRVGYRDAEKLDALLVLANLRGSPYARYVKWQRIRSYLTDGADANGDDPLEDVSSREETASYLLKLSNDLVGSAGKDAPPVLRDALTAKALVLAARGQETAARELCDKLEAAFARSMGMAKLRQWVY